MIIEDRLTQAADDARRVVDSFEAPGIQQGMGLRWHRRLAAGVAVAVAIIAVAVAGAWGMADLIANETPPADTAPGPQLEWSKVSNPPDTMHVYRLFATDDGFALASGSDVWTSTDGQQWRSTTTTPSRMYLNAGGQIMPLGDSAWIGIDAVADTPTVLLNVSGDWESVALPTTFAPANELLTATVRPDLIARKGSDVVVVGFADLSPDPEAVMRRFSPETADAGGTAQLNLIDKTVDITDAAGTTIASVPYDQIDERFFHRPFARSTVVWHSTNAEDWDQVATDETMPWYLDADEEGFVLVSGDLTEVSKVWTSSTGATWDTVPISTPPPLSGSDGFALFDGRIIASSRRGLVAIDPQGRTTTISNGDAFASLESQFTIATVATGSYGIVAAAYDNSVESNPTIALWFSPDGKHWSRQDPADVFGGQGPIKVAVGNDKVLLARDPTWVTPSFGSGFELWIGEVP